MLFILLLATVLMLCGIFPLPSNVIAFPGLYGFKLVREAVCVLCGIYSVTLLRASLHGK